MYDNIVSFFSRSTHCTPEVLRGIVDDVDSVVSAWGMHWYVTTWGNTALPSLCVYGGLPVRLRNDRYSDGDADGSSIVLPVQLWLTHQYPVEPPHVYVAACDAAVTSSSSGDDGAPAAQLRLAANHPCVDATGRCYCAALANWRPASSSLRDVLDSLAAAIESSGVCPLCSVADGAANKIDGAGADASSAGERCIVCYTAARSVVLVPCGHWCLCAACAAAVDECPVCRTTVRVRQAVAS